MNIEPNRSLDNLDYKVLIPLKIKYKKSKKDTLLKISANATGDPRRGTFHTFIGQFISPVFDEKTHEEIFSIPHQIDRRNSAKKAFVERCSWEEGRSPQIQIITNREEGEIELHFLAMLCSQDDFHYIDPEVGIEINVEEVISNSGKSQNLGKFSIQLSENSGENYPYDEEMIMRTFEKHSHQVNGEAVFTPSNLSP